MKHLAAVILIALCAASLRGAAITKTPDGTFLVTAAEYKAAVSEKGAVSSFISHGVEFIDPAADPKVDFGPLRVFGNMIAGNNIRFECTEKYMNITVSADYRAEIDAEAFRDGLGNIIKTPQRRDLIKNALFYKSGKALIVRGANMTEGYGYDWGEGTGTTTEVRLAPVSTLTLMPRYDTDILEDRRIDEALGVRDEDFDIESPTDCRVFKRGTPVIVKGTLGKKYNRLSVRILGKVYDVPVKGGKFYKEINLPAGGWYETDFLAQGDALRKEKRIKRVGVGDVFVTCGQSNATNLAFGQIDQTSGMVSVTDGKICRLAAGPAPGVFDGSDRGNFYPAFGDALYRATGVPVMIAAVGKGGSFAREWLPGTECHRYLMNRIKQLGAVTAVLWHQGESDYDTPGDEYFDTMKQIIRSTDLPWFVAVATKLYPEQPEVTQIREAQKRLAAEHVALPGPDTDTLGAEYRDYTAAHFNEKGLVRHGEMWAESVLAAMKELKK